MKIVSCNCFEGNPIKVKLDKEEQCIKLEQNFCNNNSNKETLNVSMGSYEFNFYYCPFCGKEIETSND